MKSDNLRSNVGHRCFSDTLQSPDYWNGHVIKYTLVYYNLEIEVWNQ